MASDDRWDDDRLDGDRGRGDRSHFSDPWAGVVTHARDRLRGPGIALVVTGALALAWSVAFFANLPHLDAQLDEEMRQRAVQIDNDPRIPQDQKQFQKDFLRDFCEVFKAAALPWGVAWACAAVIILAGGVCMMTRLSWGLSVFGAVVALVPLLTACCCAGGFPAGVWALVVLFNPDVRAAFRAAGRRADPYDPGFDDR